MPAGAKSKPAKKRGTRGGGGGAVSKAARFAGLPKDFSRMLGEFSAYLRMELGRGKNTVDSYLGDLLQFCEFAAQNGVSGFGDVDADILVNWISDISKISKTTTQSRKISALRTLAGFLMDEGVWKKNLGELVARPKVARAEPGVLEASQIDGIIEAAAGDAPEILRDRAMLELAYSSGLRVSELCALRESDIDPEEHILRIVGKGGKTRLVPVGAAALEAIAAYRARRAELCGGSACAELFITRRGKKISRKTFWYNLKKYARLAGVSANAKPHALRHSFATEVRRKYGIRMAGALLGHSDGSRITDGYSREAAIDELVRECGSVIEAIG